MRSSRRATERREWPLFYRISRVYMAEMAKADDSRGAGAYKARIAALGISHTEWARLIRAAPRTERDWAAGTRELPGPVETLLQLLEERPELLEVLRRILAAEERKASGARKGSRVP